MPSTTEADAPKPRNRRRRSSLSRGRRSEQAKPALGASESEPRPPQRPISPWVIAPFSGAAAAALVIGVGWMLGWPPVQPPPKRHRPAQTALNESPSRVAGLEAKVSKPAAPDRRCCAPRNDRKIRGLAARPTRRPADAVGQARRPDRFSQPGRISRDRPIPIVRSRRPLRDQCAARSDRTRDEGGKRRGRERQREGQGRRHAAAPCGGGSRVLDLSVRQGEPFKTALDSAKSLAPDAGLLKPLDGFAASGVPTSAALSRELLTIIPKLAKPAKPNEAADGSLVDRLQGRRGEPRPHRAHRRCRQ